MASGGAIRPLGQYGRWGPMAVDRPRDLLAHQVRGRRPSKILLLHIKLLRGNSFFFTFSFFLS